MTQGRKRTRTARREGDAYERNGRNNQENAIPPYVTSPGENIARNGVNSPIVSLPLQSYCQVGLMLDTVQVLVNFARIMVANQFDAIYHTYEPVQSFKDESSTRYPRCNQGARQRKRKAKANQEIPVSKPQHISTPKVYVCYHCDKPGHRRFECPDKVKIGQKPVMRRNSVFINPIDQSQNRNDLVFKPVKDGNQVKINQDFLPIQTPGLISVHKKSNPSEGNLIVLKFSYM